MNKDIKKSIKSDGLPVCICPVLCQEELNKEKRERVQVEQEKDAVIADLQHKLDSLETDYERVLHVSCNTSWFKSRVIQRVLTKL